MSLPHSSPQVVAFLESLKEEYPEEFTPDTPDKKRKQELQDIDHEILQLEQIEKEQMIAPKAKDDEWISGYGDDTVRAYDD